MYVEKRKLGKNIKYYLVYSYRDKNRVNKIRKYLGQNLDDRELELAKIGAKKEILKLLDALSTEVFLFTLTKNQIAILNRADKRIRITHLDAKDWRKFTENFVYNTNAIEGSTVQRDEVPGILDKIEVIDTEEMETKGVADAIEFIRDAKEELSLTLIKKLHKLCFEGSKPFAGKFRDVDVAITDAMGEIIHTGVPVADLEFALKDMVSWYRANKNKFKPLVLAAIIHNQFEHIHPFQDGNGRIGRLLLNFILLKNRYPPINISLEDRQEYYKTLQEYSKNHDIKPTIKFLIQQYKKTMKGVSTKYEYR
jgi:Fic family protein